MQRVPPLREIPSALARAAASFLLLACLTLPAAAQTIITPKNEKLTFTDAEITDGLLKIAFGAEYHLAGRVDGIRKYDKPVRVFIDNRARPDRAAALRAIVTDIGNRIRNLEIAITDNRDSANMTITLVRDRDLQKTIASFYGDERARDIKQTMDPQCLSSFNKDDTLAIINSNVILTVDAGDFIFADCAYEEILQALGPINDAGSVPWTTFNDDVSTGRFVIYDQLLLNILYDPRIRPGMTAQQVTAVLPAILPDVRTWVSQKNGRKAR